MWCNEDEIKETYQIEISYTERDAIIPALIESYEKATNMQELIALKRLLECLGAKVDDWVPVVF